MSARALFVLVPLLTACGGDDGNMMMMVDAPPVSSIVEVSPCPATVNATFTTMALNFDPATATITQGQVAKFVSTATHPIGPTGGTDPKLDVPEGQTKCFRFTMTGTFKFVCKFHSYLGTLTVN